MPKYLKIKRYYLIFSLLIWSFIISHKCLSQNTLTGYVIIRGVVIEGKKPLNKSLVNLFENSKLTEEKTTMPNGKFVFKLELNKEYLLTFTKEGYVTKRISIITDVPDEEAQNGIWEYKFSIELFEIVQGLDVSILDKPISKIKYYERIADFDYDNDYTKTMIKALNKLRNEVEILKDDEYQILIKEANQLYADKKYEEAIEKYDKSIDINPYSDYPDQMIYEISLYLRKKDAIDEKYSRALAEADKNYNIQNYKPALTFYKKAIDLKSLEEYPQNQISTIETLLNNFNEQDSLTRELDKQYRNAITDADFAIKKELYELAKEKYLLASGLKPNEQYPKEKINFIDNLLTEILRKEASKEELEKAYLEAITEADDYFTSSNYMVANTMYEKAISLKPEEKYPKNKIEEINKIFQTQKAIDTKYQQHIIEADNFYNTEQYPKAKALYKQALSVKPNEQYPKDQIVSIDAYLASVQAIEESFNNLIIYADDLYNNKDYLNAKSSYTEASNLKPLAEYPKNQIVEINKILLAQRNTEAQERILLEQYNAYIAKADQLFASIDYAGSKVTYEMALNIKPNEPYPLQKITEIDALLEEQKQKRMEFNKLVASADNKFNAEKYEQAKILYTNALAILPEVEYPKSKLAEIDLKLQVLLSADEFRKSKERDYKNYIRKGDSLMAIINFTASKAEFEKALTVKPDEKYPKTKIQEILEELNKINQLNQKYNSLIASADGYFSVLKFENAKTNYEKAIELKPSEQYPKDKLTETIRKITEYQQLQSDKEKLEQDFNNFIAMADDFFKNKDYVQAKTNYKSALTLIANEPYPSSKIKEIDDLIYTQNQTQLAYNAEIKKADNYFISTEYEYAKTYYEKALTIISTGQYPKDKIKEIEELVDVLKQKRKAYEKAIASADKNYNSKKWNDAISNYELALSVLPNEEYPQTKITEINKIHEDKRLAEEKIKIAQEGYKQAIANADAKFNATRYLEARSDYQAALNYKPDESYPKSKLLEIDEILKQLQKEKQISYKRAIASADSYLYQKKYTAAKSQYNKAADILPEEEYPKLKIKEIEGLLALEKADKKQKEELEKLYNKTIAEANNFFKNVDYVSAKANYQKALSYNPNSTFAKKQLTEIDYLIQQQQLANLKQEEKDRQKQMEKSKSSFVKDKDFDYSGEERKRDFLSELARVYPEGKTVEKYNKPNKKILRVILNYNGIAKEYIKVRYSYGTFYFRNGQNISQGIFNSETKD